MGGQVMKLRLAAVVAGSLFAGALALAAESGSWTGYITAAKWGRKGGHEGAEECAAKCVKEGAKLVFVNDADKKVYVIDAQDKVAGHAGHHVTVKGSVDGDTLKLESVEMAPKK